MNKRGMFFTVGGIVIAALILFAAATVVRQARVATHAENILLAGERVAASYDGVSNSVVTLMGDSGIGVDIDNLSVTFNERLPNARVGTFRSSVDDFETFLAVHDETIDFDGSSLGDDPVLSIRPYNISYSHGTFGQDARLAWETLPDSLSLDIITTDEVSCIWTFTPGSFPLSAFVQGQTTTCDDDYQVDLDQPVTISINGGNMTFSLSEGNLTVARSMTANVSMIIALPDIGVRPIVRTQDIINITIPRAGMNRIDSARLS